MSSKSFAKLGTAARDLEESAIERFKDAEALFDAGQFAGSVMMALYALEIRLKVVICRHLNLEKLPTPFQTHDLEGLLILSGQFNRLHTAKRPKNLATNWEELIQIYRRADQIRYANDPYWSREKAERVLKLFRDPTSGVLTWLEKRS